MSASSPCRCRCGRECCDGRVCSLKRAAPFEDIACSGSMTVTRAKTGESLETYTYTAVAADQVPRAVGDCPILDSGQSQIITGTPWDRQGFIETSWGPSRIVLSGRASLQKGLPAINGGTVQWLVELEVSDDRYCVVVAIASVSLFGIVNGPDSTESSVVLSNLRVDVEREGRCIKSVRIRASGATTHLLAGGDTITVTGDIDITIEQPHGRTCLGGEGSACARRCCFSDGSCANLTPAECASLGGISGAENEVCGKPCDGGLFSSPAACCGEDGAQCFNTGSPHTVDYVITITLQRYECNSSGGSPVIVEGGTQVITLSGSASAPGTGCSDITLTVGDDTGWTIPSVVSSPAQDLDIYGVGIDLVFDAAGFVRASAYVDYEGDALGANGQMTGTSCNFLSGTFVAAGIVLTCGGTQYHPLIAKIEIEASVNKRGACP